jgi:NAD(P)-dependent dehydrogenase (short-subunit alcohol dehydrogenase family)
VYDGVWRTYKHYKSTFRFFTPSTKMPVLKCEESLLKSNLVGKTIVVTGGNAGIGLETVKQLAKQGATVVFTSRNMTVGTAIADQINAGLTLGNKVEAMQLNLVDLNSVKSFAASFQQKYKQLHVLVNNAGVMNLPKLEKTKEGVEVQFATNHLGHFLLTNLLLDVLKASQPSRIICVSSCYHYFAMGKKGYIDFDDLSFGKRKYDGWTAYAQSKLANVLHARELAKRLEGTGVTAVSLHPGRCLPTCCDYKSLS